MFHYEKNSSSGVHTVVFVKLLNILQYYLQNIGIFQPRRTVKWDPKFGYSNQLALVCKTMKWPNLWSNSWWDNRAMPKTGATVAHYSPRACQGFRTSRMRQFVSNERFFVPILKLIFSVENRKKGFKIRKTMFRKRQK